MKNYDWKNSFPEPTQKFHERLCSTLSGLEEKEKCKMKRKSLKRGLIIAAAVLVLGAGAFASSGRITFVTGSSSSRPDYTNLPPSEQLEENIGFAPKLIEEFSNGYTFDNASKLNNEIVTYEDDKKIAVANENGNSKYSSISSRYTNGDDYIILSAQLSGYDDSTSEEREIYNGISLKYTSYTGKFVPPNYEKTEQDLKDEADGKIIFSYGSDDVEIIEIQGVSWIQDGISYNITAMDSPLDADGLTDMAKELIDFEQ